MVCAYRAILRHHRENFSPPPPSGRSSRPLPWAEGSGGCTGAGAGLQAFCPEPSKGVGKMHRLSAQTHKPGHVSGGPDRTWGHCTEPAGLRVFPFEAQGARRRSTVARSCVRPRLSTTEQGSASMRRKEDHVDTFVSFASPERARNPILVSREGGQNACAPCISSCLKCGE